ncbi:hypothetical protein AALO_G00304660 [Alosa alosa]|uniref:Uncharacterized protein n=1 Tax=Alosa alosa TaxID=278164 RepID=A0AAV6FF77_9TELE|nr:hypothetical protein AALO_G00304660 [Alosa alosa]
MKDCATKKTQRSSSSIPLKRGRQLLKKWKTMLDHQIKLLNKQRTKMPTLCTVERSADGQLWNPQRSKRLLLRGGSKTSMKLG